MDFAYVCYMISEYQQYFYPIKKYPSTKTKNKSYVFIQLFPVTKKASCQTQMREANAKDLIYII